MFQTFKGGMNQIGRHVKFTTQCKQNTLNESKHKATSTWDKSGKKN